MYSIKSSYREIHENKDIAELLQILYDDSLYFKVEEEYEKLSLPEIEKQVLGFSAQGMVDVANYLLDVDNRNSIIPIWTKEEIEQDSTRKTPFLLPFLLKGKKAPAVIVCPGGGYEYVSYYNEGFEIAQALNKSGFHVFVLKYRVAPAVSYPKPMEDLIRAIQYVRARSEKYGIIDKKTAILGFSAGGHLCGYTAGIANQDTRPDAAVLCYPVITMGKETHSGSRTNLLHLSEDETETKENLKKWAKYSCENIVTKDYPPTYLWHCKGDDAVSVRNSEIMAEALKKAGVKYQIHLYPDGAHGIGMGIGTTAEGWLE